MKFILLITCLLLSGITSHCQSWNSIGATNTPGAPYDYYYYKLVQINNDVDQYASVFELSVQGDRNYFDQQGIYQIQVVKYTLTSGRFDGMEIRCTSGNPSVADFFVYKNTLWVRSKYKWGSIYYRNVSDFTGLSPMSTSPFGQTTTAPSGYMQSISGYGLKCDFDNNQFYKLPYTDVTGKSYFDGNVGIGTGNPSEKLEINTEGVSNISLSNSADVMGVLGAIKFKMAGSETSRIESERVVASGRMSDLKFMTGGSAGISEKMRIRNDGNIGVGTTKPTEKLAVNGTVLAKKIRVSQSASDWPDYVFDSSYQLPSLEFVSTFIQSNKHLPDMPPASVIEKEGQDLGEVQKLLLKKMEEMTLYMIDISKENERLKSRIEELETKSLKAKNTN